MSRVKEMISALRKCAKEHENDVVCTGQIITSSLCRDVADYLEADRWHYPSKGEYPTDGEETLIFFKHRGEKVFKVDKYSKQYNGWQFSPKPIAWQYIVPPKEEA